MENYTVVHATPSVETYIALRAATGLPSKTPEAATAGLANTLFAVQTAHSSSPDEIFGMGSMIGDGGCFFQIADIAVLPAYQGKGLEKMIMKELKDWMYKNVLKSGVIMLFADGPAIELYKHFGIEETPGFDSFQCRNGLSFLMKREGCYIMGDNGRSSHFSDHDPTLQRQSGTGLTTT